MRIISDYRMKICGTMGALTFGAKNTFRWFQIAHGMVTVNALAQGIMSNLYAQRICIVVHTSLIIETLFAQFFRCKTKSTRKMGDFSGEYIRFSTNVWHILWLSQWPRDIFSHTHTSQWLHRSVHGAVFRCISAHMVPQYTFLWLNHVARRDRQN